MPIPDVGSDPLTWSGRIPLNHIHILLGIDENPHAQAELMAVAKEVYEVVADEFDAAGSIVANMLRNFTMNQRVMEEFENRLDRIPSAVKASQPTQNYLQAALHRYICREAPKFREAWERKNPNHNKTKRELYLASMTPKFPKRRRSASPPKGSEAGDETPAGPPAQTGFQYNRPYVFPNLDIQIIRADAPSQPLAIRLADFLLNQTNPMDISENGDWVDFGKANLGKLKQVLMDENYLFDKETIWMSPTPLDQLNPLTLNQAQAGEARLININLISVVQRLIQQNYPILRRPSPEPENSQRRRSPLARPNLTIIIRSGETTGKHLPHSPST